MSVTRLRMSDVIAWQEAGGAACDPPCNPGVLGKTGDCALLPTWKRSRGGGTATGDGSAAPSPPGTAKLNWVLTVPHLNEKRFLRTS
ncbi:hypothetical protein MHYP_G00106520 [Metynnis hypsauchen]